MQVAPEGNRSVLEGLVEERTAERRAAGEMIDVSVGGARIIAVAEFPVGTRVQLMMSAAVVGSSISLTGEVRWREAVETGHMYGLRLVNPDPEVERLLRSHLGER